MKKVLFAVLCAGLFFACGNKKQQEAEALVDTTTTVCEEVVEAIEEEVAPVEEAAPVAKKNTTNNKKTTANSNTGLKAADSKSNAAPTLEDQTKNAANRVAGKAIEKAETEATNTIVNSGKKQR